MKICLIYPPQDKMIKTNVPSVVDDVTGCYPPLGLLYVAAAARQDSGHEVQLIDCVAEKLDADALAIRIKDFSPDVVGIQVLTFTLVNAVEVARTVKTCSSGTTIVAGGPHVNLYPRESLNLECFDYVLLGEAENNFPRFLNTLSDPGEMDRVPGVVFKRNGEFVFGPTNELREDLDTLPDPARDLLKLDLYSSILSKGKRSTTIMSSRGCPARCVFCDRPHLGKRFRARSAKSVVDEMEKCINEHGIDEFIFYDDTFTIDRNRVFEICRLLKERDIRVRWDIRARISNVDREMLEALKGSGCSRIHFGIESGSEKVLKAIRKGVSLDKAREVFRDCRKLGIETLAYFMFGLPEEDHEEARQTINYALSIDCDYIHVAATTPFPGTELYREGLKSGVIREDYWQSFAMGPDSMFVPGLWDQVLTIDDIQSYMRYLYAQFYRRPSYILRRVMAIRSVNEFISHCRAGLKIMRLAKEPFRLEKGVV